MPFIARVLRFLRTSGMPPTLFGRKTMNDPRFVDDIINGRQVRARTERRVIAWIDEQERLGAEAVR